MGFRVSVRVPLALVVMTFASCAGQRGAIETVSIEARPVADVRAGSDGPRVLAVVAHPDDEFSFAGVMFKTATHLGGVCEVVTITDGQGGFKYATLAAALHGLDLTDEATGRRELPAIRRREQLESARLLGLRRLHYLGQRDHRYTTDLAEVLGEASHVWDLPAVRGALDHLLDRGDYDAVLVHPPSITTHAHHQAATFLALEAVARMDPARRPLVLCSEVEEGDPNGAPWLDPKLRDVTPLAQIAGGPFLFERTQRFGYRDRLDYSMLIDAAIARHVSQGSMLALMGHGTREEYWALGEPTAAQLTECAHWFARLTERQFPSREYEESAGVNTGAGAPSR